jgi:hypothetical protein
MSVHAGPEIANDGLVFAYDIANTEKSWKGAPTTNLFGTNLSATNNARLGPKGKTYTGWRTIGISNDNPRTTLFSGSIALSPSTFYTLSCVYWSSNNIVDDVYLRFNDTGWTESNSYIQPFTAQSTTRNGSFTITDFGDGWKKCVGTFQTLATTTSLIQFFFDNDVAGVEIFISEIQLEQQSFATPFVSGTRSNTQSILDLTGKHTLTSNSLTYNNNNTFAFSSGNITVPYSTDFDFSKQQTIIMWMKPGTGSNSARRNPYNQAYGGSGTITHEVGQGFNYYFGTNGGNSTPYVGKSSSFTVAPNEIAFVAFTRNQDTNTVSFYKNGVLTNTTDAGGYASTANGNSPILIGTGYTTNFIGELPVVTVYNKELSPSEIKQNFNALRGRFGI